MKLKRTGCFCLHFVANCNFIGIYLKEVDCKMPICSPIGLMVLLLSLLHVQCVDINKIPLSYAFDWDMLTKLPIDISFNHSAVYSTSPTEQLFLLNYNLSLNVQYFPEHQERDRIEIGLKYPSDFISAMAASFKIPYDEVEFGKEEYLSVILFDDNYVESRDIFVEGEAYKVHVKFNFGDDMTIDDKPCRLIDGETIYFEEYLIREALNKMTKENLINFKFHEKNHTIELMGELQNLPKLTLVRGDYIFKMKIEGNVINYLPAVENKERVTLIGYKALYEFSKFKFDEESIIFKRTTYIYQLYLFLAYFTLLSVFLIYTTRKNIYDSSQFVKHALKWVFLKDRGSRIEVLKSELQ